MNKNEKGISLKDALDNLANESTVENNSKRRIEST